MDRQAAGGAAGGAGGFVIGTGVEEHYPAYDPPADGAIGALEEMHA